MDELEIIQYQHVEGLSVFVNTVRYRSPHFHQDWELLWVLDAPLLVTCRQTFTVVKPGEVVLFSPNVAHELRQVDKICTFLCMQISSRPLTANIVVDDIRLEPYLSPEHYARLHRDMLDIAGAYFRREDFYELYCVGRSSLLVYNLLTHLPCRRLSPEEMSNIDRKNARLLRLVDFVEKNYMHKLLLSDFAKQEGCSVSYLSHFIKATMNQTFQDYVCSVRFTNACKMISAGKESLVNISRATGFSDYRYFSRAFQHAYGLTPAEYSTQTQNIIYDENDQTCGHSLHSEETLLTRSQSVHVLKRFEQSLK